MSGLGAAFLVDEKFFRTVSSCYLKIAYGMICSSLYCRKENNYLSKAFFYLDMVGISYHMIKVLHENTKENNLISYLQN